MSPEVIFFLADTFGTCKLESVLHGLEMNECAAVSRAAIGVAFVIDAARKKYIASLQMDIPLFATKVFIFPQ